MSSRACRLPIAAIVIFGAMACQVAESKDVFRHSLRRAHGTIATSFTAPRTGRYWMSLEFAWPIDDRPISAMVSRAATSLRSDTFDFSWELLTGRKVITRGSGSDGFRRVVDTPGDDAGSPPKSRALVFAEFDGEQGVNYTLKFTPGAGFPTILKVSPVLKVTRPDR